MIEQGRGWTKSSFSNGNGGNNCVEVAFTPVGNLAVRNSKSRRDIVLFTKDEWAAFLAGVKAGEFDVDE